MWGTIMTVEVVDKIAEVRRRVAAARGKGLSIALVPTMGALHEGHLSLARAARTDGYVIMSIFVNPTQFGPGEDFARYPRDLAQDVQKAESAGVDLVFAPPVEEMYDRDDATFVEVAGTLTKGLCAPFRPGHFRGVATVVAKLFNIVQPDRAYFGEKDYQQLQVIKRMARDLRMPVEVVGVPTVREADGLAMSSRNAHLSQEERKAALVLNEALMAAKKMAQQGDRDAHAIAAEIRRKVEEDALVRLQYVEVCDAATLEPLERLQGRAVIALAAAVGTTRLIDNVIVEGG
jgi:pantoate--beta-alanine ligase